MPTDREGPLLVTPPAPKPYYSCEGCYHKTAVYYIGIYCSHPNHLHARSLQFYPVTPTWCPLLPKETGK